MSVLIAIKDKDRVYFGADKQVTCGNLKQNLTNNINFCNQTELWLEQ